MKRRHILISFVIMATCHACYANEQNINKVETQTANLPVEKSLLVNKDNTDKQEATKTLTLTGVIEYKKFEGGFYAFISDDGRKFTPHNLPAEFKQDGLKVRVSGNIMTEMMTFTMFGKLLHIDTIESIAVE